METPELTAEESTIHHAAKEDSCHDLEALEHIVGLIRKGYRIDTDTWVQILRELQAVWPVSSKGSFRLWHVSDFPRRTEP